jgi:type VI secretion system protein ImpF
MAREPSIRLLPSLVDRLIDREPRVTSEAPSTQSQSMRELKESLRRDLEWLLNARRTPIEAPDSAQELRRSVFYFGLPDYTAYSLKTENDKRRLARIMETTIGIFEPRLTAISVNVLENAGPLRVLRFHIEAMVRMQPAPLRVFFDARLELSTNNYRIEGDTRAR